MIKSVFLPAVLLATLGLFTLEGSGYLEIDIQRIEQLSDKKYFDVSGLKIRKHNKTRKIYGNATLHIDLGNDVLPEIKAYKKSGGEYRLLPYKMPKTPFCEGINGDSYFYPEFAQTSSFPKQPVPCPMPKGTYELYGYHSTGANIPIMIMPSGDYAVELIGWKKNVEIYRFRGYGSVINI